MLGDLIGDFESGLPRLTDEAFMAKALNEGKIPTWLETYFQIMGEWGISEPEASALLGYDQRPTTAETSMDALRRISHTLGIYRSLHTLLVKDSANAWVRQPNTVDLFQGKPALELLRTGTEGFEAVRVYLAANAV